MSTNVLYGHRLRYVNILLSDEPLAIRQIYELKDDDPTILINSSYGLLK